VSRLTIVSQADVSHTDDYGARGYTAMSRRSDARVFRAAMRHSRLVRLLRVAIPGAAVLGVVGVFLAATVLDPLRALARLPVDIGGLVVSGTKITTQGPRLAGFTQDRRPYVVTARKASQDVTKPDTLELQDLRATIEMKDSGAFELTAQVGVFEMKADRLTLQQNIVVNSASYQARLSEAVVNVRTSHMVSEKPVEVTMQQGTINANRLEVSNSGEVVRFEGGVTMVLTPDQSGDKAGTR
jgi:lipopolysaccharide export system protein LptC